MGDVVLLLAFVIGLLFSALFLLISFFLLPWARHRLGGWALALIPLSTFAGPFFAWTVLWMFIKAVEV